MALVAERFETGQDTQVTGLRQQVEVQKADQHRKRTMAATTPASGGR